MNRTGSGGSNDFNLQTVTFDLELLLGGIRTSIFMASANNVGAGTTNQLEILTDDVTFTRGMVTGIRATGTPFRFTPNHGWNRTELNFSVAAVPLPASLPLPGVALPGMLAPGRRRRST